MPLLSRGLEGQDVVSSRGFDFDATSAASLTKGRITRAFMSMMMILGRWSSILCCQGLDMGAQRVLEGAPYLLGVGTGDVTGPIVETNMFGYASVPQTDSGLHMRQRARAFVIADAQAPYERVLFITADIWSGDTAVRKGILERLQELYPGVYSESNFALSGTHSHSGVGGYTGYLLPQITSRGFVRQSYEAVINGSLHAAILAHESLRPGRLTFGAADVPEGGINRSPHSYLANPAEERARYPGDTDPEMSLLKLVDAGGQDLGFMSFFAVHGVSLYENNTLISGDNKGMASFLYESYMSPTIMPGHAPFVAGFVQSTSGDITPNTLGAFCESPGQPWDGQLCEFEHSTCGNRTQDCHGRGPGFRVSDFESNHIIASRQYDTARALMDGPNLKRIHGRVRSLHAYVDMSNHTFILRNGTEVTTCSPALGYSFAGGTTDGPGAFSFIQGENATTPQNPLWEMFKGVVTAPPSEEEKRCHWPKPILLNVGRAQKPYQWSPTIIDIQIFRIGQLVILILPSEFTTMSARRLKEAVKGALQTEGILDEPYIVAVGLANTYSHYTTTREEYSVQRYEGASTLYGPHQLDAYIDLYTKVVPYLADDAPASPPPGPEPEDLLDKAISLQPGVVQDNVPPRKHFGDVVTDVLELYRPGETVTVVFEGANPRNNLRLEETYLAVEYYVEGDWRVVRTDSHPSTIFRWKRTNKLLGYSTVTIQWTIEGNTDPGIYRIKYFGDSRSLWGTISPFEGCSSPFDVTS